ncbi:MAG: GNAT family N-acetyltransferase [Candidatus Lokiarchaeota archaeon]|nr:GNAT family N-acetyltransferase [Candidatus Lokiarchaeota archaeon]MBD3341315.1 GNAT family N-acetyltransferase [Candidatus Lokiarchaeota archaeon]
MFLSFTKPLNMIIREFSRNEINEITDLMRKLCSLKGQEFNEKRWRKSLEKQMEIDTNPEVLVAFNKNSEEVVGMAHCSIKTSDKGFRFGYVSNLIVKEEKRRTGIGENLMRHIIDHFKKNHIQSIRLALKNNLDEAAQKLFIKLGFNEQFRIYELQL